MFILDAEALEKKRVWLLEHDKTCIYADPDNGGAIGGRLTYRFTPTSLGCVQTIQCACKAECDLSNYDW